MISKAEARLIAEELAAVLADRIRPDGRDYTVKDIQGLTGINKNLICRVRLHGEYRAGNKRLFRREIIDSRRRQGLNLAVD